MSEKSCDANIATWTGIAVTCMGTGDKWLMLVQYVGNSPR
jgi:hypothetical protein